MYIEFRDKSVIENLKEKVLRHHILFKGDVPNFEKQTNSRRADVEFHYIKQFKENLFKDY